MADKFNMSDVMISYSRRDKGFVQALTNAIKNKGLEPWVDWDDIPPTVNWWAEIQAGIEAAHCIVFVISPQSVASEICYREIEHAVLNNKRIIPILYQEVNDPTLSAKMHPALASHNWIYFREQDDLKQAFKTLLEAIQTDFAYTEQHTRLLVLAADWNERQRPDSLLLRGENLQKAEDWLDKSAGKAPEATNLQRSYIRASRKAATGLSRLIATIAAFVIIVLLGISSFAIFKAIDAENQARIAQDALYDAEVANADADAARQTELVARDNADAAATAAAQAATDEQNALHARGTAEQGQQDAESAAENASNLEATAIAQQATAVAGQQTAEAAQGTAMVLQQTAEAGLGLAEDDAQTAQANAATALADANTQATQAANAQNAANTAQAGQLTAQAAQGTALALQQTSDANVATSRADVYNANVTGTANAATAVAANATATRNAATARAANITATAAAQTAAAANITATVAAQTAAAANITATFVQNNLNINSLMGQAQLQLPVNRPLALHLALLAMEQAQRDNVVTNPLETAFFDIMFSSGLRSTFQGTWGALTSIAYNRNGTQIVTGNANHTVQLWNATDGSLIRTFGTANNSNSDAGHTARVTTVAFSHDGSRIVSGSDDRTVRLWDTNRDSNALLHTFNDATAGITSVAYSPTEDWIVFASLDEKIYSLDTVTFAPRWPAISLSNESTYWQDLSMSVAFSPDGLHFASADSAGLQIRDSATGFAEHPLPLTGHADYIRSIAYNPAGTRIVTGSQDRTVRIWHVEDKREEFRLTGHTGYVLSVAYSSNGDYVVSGGADRSIKVWVAGTGRQLSTMTGHSNQINGLAFNPAITRIASASEDRSLRFWDFNSAALNTINSETLFDYNPHNRQEILTLAYNPTQKIIVTGNVLIHVWNAETGRLVRTITERTIDTNEGHTDLVFAVDTNSDGSLIFSASADRTVRVWDADTEAGELPLHTLRGHDSYVTSVDFNNNPTTPRIVSGSWDGTIRIWDYNAETPTSDVITTGAGLVRTVAYNPSGTIIAVGNENHTIQLWNANSHALENTLVGHTTPVTTVAFNPAGTRLVSGGEDGSVRVWNTATGQMTILGTHAGSVTSVAFSPNGNSIISSATDGSIYLWDAIQNAYVTSYPGHLASANTLAFDETGSRFFSGSSDGTIRIWGNGIQSAIDQVCANLALPTLTAQELEQYLAYGVTGNYICPGSSSTTMSVLAVSALQNHPDATSTFSPSPSPSPAPSLAPSLPSGYIAFESIYGDWQPISTGYGFIATGGNAILISTSTIDLQAYTNPVLRFASLRDGSDGLAILQVSVNDGDWQQLAFVENADISLNLSVYLGQSLDFQFIWLPVEGRNESWQLHDIRIEDELLPVSSPTTFWTETAATATPEFRTETTSATATETLIPSPTIVEFVPTATETPSPSPTIVEFVPTATETPSSSPTVGEFVPTATEIVDLITSTAPASAESP